ncbi:MAG TPA: hypothetical protein VGR69_07175 [Candidatus Rubrimentiphilum sp.]|nr:hypothetical protein [Candidatus Rubrimentiphilum sp.]
MGEIYTGQSPVIGLSYAFTTKFFLEPNPRPNNQGVLPDVKIATTERDIQLGKDPVLDYALRLADT